MNIRTARRIIILTNTYPPDFGAAPARIRRMAKGLQQAGYEVVVLTGMPSYPRSEIKPEYKNKWRIIEHDEQVQVRRYWISAYSGKSKWGRFRQMFSLALSIGTSIPFLLKSKPYRIIVQYPPIALPMLAVILKKITGASLTVNFSDLWPFAMVDLGVVKEDSWVYRLLEYIEKTVYKAGDSFMAQSQEVADRIREHTKAPILIYRTGADTQSFLPQPNPKPSQGKKLKIVYAGVLGMAHGILELCKKVDFKQTCSELHIYGDGLERASIAAWKDQHPNEPVYLNSPVHPAQIPEVLSQHQVMIIPQKTRIRGTVPSKIYDAMAAGLPIIFIGAGEGARLVRQHGCGYVVPTQDYQALNEAIQRMCRLNNLERQALGDAGRNASEKYFDREKIVASLIQWLEDPSTDSSPSSQKKTLT